MHRLTEPKLRHDRDEPVFMWQAKGGSFDSDATLGPSSTRTQALIGVRPTVIPVCSEQNTPDLRQSNRRHTQRWFGGGVCW